MMRFRPGKLFIASALLPALAAAQDHGALDDSLVQQYCFGCHNSQDWAGSLALDVLDTTHIPDDAKIWELVLRKLEAGMMPPAGEPRPSPDEVHAFTREVIARLDAPPYPPAGPALHRLNRNEYANAIRDLLDLEVNTRTLLPQDNATDGFDNVASGLGFSPALVQGFTSAAQKISRLAIGDMSATEESIAYKSPPRWMQDLPIDGMPLGTRGGMRVEHYFPLDAEYQITVQGGAGFGRVRASSVVMTLDGQRLDVTGMRGFRLPLSAGKHVFTISLLDEERSAGVNDIYKQYNIGGSIGGLEIKGPYNASGVGETPSRKRIFSCYPGNDDEAQACARQVLGQLARRAYRMPADKVDMEPLMAFYARGFEEGGFETGIQQGLARILTDPRFLIRFEETPEGVEPGQAWALAPHEVASRLSFFLWSSIPDDRLLELADNGSLLEPAVLQAEVRRMLADPRAEALIDNFFGQWLRLRELETLTPESDAFNDNLRYAFIEETRLLAGHVMAADRPLRELLSADYSFLNERLAKHYGISGVYGDHFRKVSLPPDSPRQGLLGHASLLTLTSTASRTSPVIRGSWILENLLHAPVPAPPPGVETNLDGDGTVVLSNSIRERLEQHRENPSCHSCHSVIDPVGFALENFDMIGAWRERDGDSPVDATGTLVDGTRIQGPADLRRALLDREKLFVSTFTEKLLTYALGRSLEYHDMPAVRAILREAEPLDYRFSAIVLAVVQSPLFLQRSANL